MAPVNPKAVAKALPMPQVHAAFAGASTHTGHWSNLVKSAHAHPSPGLRIYYNLFISAWRSIRDFGLWFM